MTKLTKVSAAVAATLVGGCVAAFLMLRSSKEPSLQPSDSDPQVVATDSGKSGSPSDHPRAQRRRGPGLTGFAPSSESVRGGDVGPPSSVSRPTADQEQRLQQTPKVISSSGNPSRMLSQNGANLRESILRDLRSDLKVRLDIGEMSCYRAGCIVRVTYKDPEAAMLFKTAVLGIKEFAEWPAPRMFVSTDPNKPAAPEDWCLWSSGEEAMAHMSLN